MNKVIRIIKAKAVNKTSDITVGVIIGGVLWQVL